MKKIMELMAIILTVFLNSDDRERGGITAETQQQISTERTQLIQLFID